MNYFIGHDRKPVEFDYYIDEGEEGKVFKFGNNAVKIYWDNLSSSSHPFLSLVDVIKLSSLKSNHILLPREVIYNEHDEFVGYATKYISGYFGDSDFVLNYDKERQVIDNMPLFIYKNKIKKLYKEVYYLSKNGVLLSDINVISNYIFNGNYWLIDPGCYSFSDEDFRSILIYNYSLLNEFLCDLSLRIDCNCVYFDNIIDLIQEDGKQFETTKQFRKRFNSKHF